MDNTGLPNDNSHLISWAQVPVLVPIPLYLGGVPGPTPAFYHPLLYNASIPQINQLMPATNAGLYVWASIPVSPNTSTPLAYTTRLTTVEELGHQGWAPEIRAMQEIAGLPNNPFNASKFSVNSSNPFASSPLAQYNPDPAVGVYPAQPSGTLETSFSSTNHPWVGGSNPAESPSTGWGTRPLGMNTMNTPLTSKQETTQQHQPNHAVNEWGLLFEPFNPSAPSPFAEQLPESSVYPSQPRSSSVPASTSVENAWPQLMSAPMTTSQGNDHFQHFQSPNDFGNRWDFDVSQLASFEHSASSSTQLRLPEEMAAESYIDDNRNSNIDEPVLDFQNSSFYEEGRMGVAELDVMTDEDSEEDDDSNNGDEPVPD
ncbi:hypothetical protein M413DRAFT_13100 [Hebeloma cylindrosporum]|uniref:Uncharacterized protein n=1 Tax=Hebeloma cylindrosporum TaxID=76867 RepID=A0A0C3BMJ2_HEBCY|nr:hypothetical protein M413DRAFT_13100 [Hebeloma cylindrosporum h7]